MKHLYKLLILIFAVPTISAAQSNYKPGAVVNLKGDTLRGFIDLREWNSNPDGISFKTALSDAQPQNFTVGDIGFFSITDVAAYQKFTCSISTDDVNPQNLNTYRDTGFKTATVFLKVLQKGKNVALYSYTDRLKTRYYFAEPPAYVPTELTFRLYSTGDATTRTGNTVTEDTYRKQLFAIAAKYNVLNDGLTDALQSANYNYVDLLEVVSKINQISKEEYKKKYADQTKVRLYAGAAANIAAFNCSPSAIYVIDGGPASKTYVGPAISFGASFAPNPSTDRVEFRLDVTFASIKYDAEYKLLVDPYVPVKATFNQLSIAFSPQVIFNVYNAEKFKVYIGVAGIFDFFSYRNSYFGSQDPKVLDSGLGEANPFYFNNLDDALALKAGVRIGRNVEIFGSYFSNMAVSQGGYFQMTNSTRQVGLIYFFGK